MRVGEGFITRVGVRLRRGLQWGRLARVRVRGRAVGAACVRRAVVRGRTLAAGRLARAVVAGPLGRVVSALLGRLARGRLGRIAGERLDRPHVVGLLAGGGAAVALALLSPLLGATEQSRADPGRDRIPPAATAVASPTRFELAREIAVRPRRPSRGGREYYRRTTSRHVPSSAETGFLPLYREAARTFGVSWRLIASIHRQETAFSTVPGTYHGLNAFGCCAGPMQFNLKNGPPSTWALYRDAHRLGDRPRRYPHRTRHHPSVYDDFDAIMAAGALLRDGGATDVLGSGAWTAAYAYYGHDLFGVGYASQVVARAQGWELNGFCLNCPEDAAFVAVLDDLYGVDARRQLRAAERRREDKKDKRKSKRDDAEASRQAGEQTDRDAEPPPLPSSEREPVATPPITTPAPSTTTSPAATTEAPPPPLTPAAPPAKTACTPVTRLLGCRD